MSYHTHLEYTHTDHSYEIRNIKPDTSHEPKPKQNPFSNPDHIDPTPKYYTSNQDDSLAFENKSGMSKSDIARKAAATRKSHDPDAFRKMGSKGGKAKHKNKDDSE